MKKRLMILAVMTVLLLAPVLSAQAGQNRMDVAAEGKGIAVYTSSSGGTRAGLLYNGFSEDLSLEATNGLYSCMLTVDFTVWLDMAEAQKNQPDSETVKYYSDEWDEKMPCDIFIAEVIRPDAPFYTSPDHSHLSVKHAEGTLVKVCGEFGNDYFVIYGEGIYQQGFMPKSVLRKVRDMTYSQACYESLHWGLEDVGEMTVYTDGSPIAVGTSATGYSDMDPRCLENGETVTVMAVLDGWVQIDGGYFMELRFLDPDRDHSVTCATVKTSTLLNRLKVRYAKHLESIPVKLSSGVRVQVPAHTDEWASVYVTGPGGGAWYSGSVKMEFLVFGDASKVKDGSTRVRCTRELYGNSKYDVSPEKLWWKEFSLPAGTEMTVIGICTESDDGWERYFCLLDDGTAVTVEDYGGVLEPLEGPGVKVKTASRVKMRMGPSKEAEEILTLNQGTGVEVLLRGENWTIVKYKDQVGYVMSKYLQFP